MGDGGGLEPMFAFPGIVDSRSNEIVVWRIVGTYPVQLVSHYREPAGAGMANIMVPATVSAAPVPTSPPPTAAVP